MPRHAISAYNVFFLYLSFFPVFILSKSKMSARRQN